MAPYGETPALQCGPHPLLNPAACTSGSDRRVGTQALPLPGVIRLSSDAVCRDCPGDDNSDGSVRHPSYLRAASAPGLGISLAQKGQHCVSRSRQSKLHTDLHSLETVAHLWLSPQSAASTMAHPLVHMFIFQHTLLCGHICMHIKHTCTHTAPTVCFKSVV